MEKELTVREISFIGKISTGERLPESEEGRILVDKGYATLENGFYALTGKGVEFIDFIVSETSQYVM